MLNEIGCFPSVAVQDVEAAVFSAVCMAFAVPFVIAEVMNAKKTERPNDR